MRKLLLVAVVAIAGLVVYRQRNIDRWERTLGLRDGAGDGDGAGDAAARN
jgi:hypothetical protein